MQEKSYFSILYPLGEVWAFHPLFNDHHNWPLNGVSRKIKKNVEKFFPWTSIYVFFHSFCPQSCMMKDFSVFIFISISAGRSSIITPYQFRRATIFMKRFASGQTQTKILLKLFPLKQRICVFLKSLSSIKYWLSVVKHKYFAIKPPSSSSFSSCL